MSTPSRSILGSHPALPAAPPPATSRRRAVPGHAAVLLLAALLAGCGAPEDKFPPVCPALSLVPDAGQLTRFSGAGHDASDMVLRAQITAVPAQCADGDDRHHVKATLHVEADVTRGIAAQGGAPQPTYFVAVAEAGRVLQEQDFPLVTKFPPNSDSATANGEDVELLLPVTKSKSAAAYHIYVGFRLSPDELAYNRAHPTP